MDKARAAEWMLRRLVGAERAAEMVGDLLEGRAGAGRGALTWAGSVRFWASVVWLCVVFSWRTPVATVAAVVAGVFLAFWPWALALSHRRVGHSVTGQALYLATDCAGVSVLLWGEAVFSFVRFGYRSELTKLAVKAAVLGSFATCFLWWLPYARTVLILGILALCLFQVWDVNRRSAFLTWSVVLAMAYYTARFFVDSIFANVHWGTGMWNLYLAVALVPVLMAFTSVLLHRRLLSEAKEVVS